MRVIIAVYMEDDLLLVFAIKKNTNHFFENYVKPLATNI